MFMPKQFRATGQIGTSKEALDSRMHLCLLIPALIGFKQRLGKFLGSLGHAGLEKQGLRNFRVRFPLQVLLVCAGVVLILNPPVLAGAPKLALNHSKGESRKGLSSLGLSLVASGGLGI